MRITRKPVRKCHDCLLNMGSRCWGYEYPHRQWREKRRCPAYGNAGVYERYREWQRQPNVKTPRELRQNAHPRRHHRHVYHLEE